ncbi:hypothetical protein [Streptomyces sp. NPDC058694]|uniref:P-loop NTPase n=1 Tax=Streptomyces sp. NPDC058694 TaxID=3346603 RepID=UPI0036661C90
MALNPDTGVLPFTPLRDPELQDLIRWCRNGAEGSPIRLLTGVAGIGKTRLLLEAADRLRPKGWACGWVRPRCAAAAVNAAEQRQRPALLIVDDADTVDDLPQLITALADCRPSPRIRVVLSARDFSDWWIAASGNLHPDVLAALPSSSEQLHLASLNHTPRDLGQYFAQAVRHFARYFAVSVPANALDEACSTASLSDIQAAAAVAARSGFAGPVNLDAALRELFTAEEEWWSAIAESEGLHYSAEMLNTAVVFAALVGAESSAQCVRRLRVLPGFGSVPEDRLQKLAQVLRKLYPKHSDDWLDPHLPARLMERYAVQRLLAHPPLPAALSAAALTT